MFNGELDLDEVLADIPAEYQETFRQTIGQELAEDGGPRTDREILDYLRRRRDDFGRGAFIRPDGRTGIIAYDPEQLYEQALPELLRGGGQPVGERRRTRLKIGLLLLVALLFLGAIWRGRSRREAAVAAVATETPVADSPPATPTLPTVVDAETSLQTIGRLGGALTLGRPSAIELHYGRSDEVIALPIDPSQPTPKGELRYNEATMLSDNPVAVWLFGTALNYAIGIPDGLVRNLAPGDRVMLTTDTGASLSFVVAETRQGASHDAGRMFSQNRIGLTLFALPAVADDDVPYVIALYDSREEQGESAGSGVGQSVPFAAGALRVTAVTYHHTSDGELRIVIRGTQTRGSLVAEPIVSLSAIGIQSAATPLTLDEEGEWMVDLTLPEAAVGQPVLAEFRALPDGQTGGEPILIHLGEAPRLLERLEGEIRTAWWGGEGGAANLEIAIHNPSDGAVYVGPDFIRPVTGGGDAYELNGQVIPRLPGQAAFGLPRLIDPGETVTLRMSFLPPSASVQVQLGADLWEISGFPTGQPPLGD